MTPGPLTRTRFIPLQFACGCIISQHGTTVYCETCRAHTDQHHASLVDDANVAYYGCDCPGCAWGRHADERGQLPDRALDADNWRFLAILHAREQRK